jgi:hypothetical protein
VHNPNYSAPKKFQFQKIHVKISLSEDSVKGIYSVTAVARTIIEDSSTVQLSRQQY